MRIVAVGGEGGRGESGGVRSSAGVEHSLFWKGGLGGGCG